uniref:Reverse transcriptase domain-containing protein n=1 Tax=Tanacetum cinerariifolium TaxID=118510 RepID=A0A6L2KB74_TANCI|nr:reverse transcriptase domain-containing protein [Tanacetum cinerariifolium]
MADMRTMSELLQAPTEGYRDAIVIPTILAENFKLKIGLLSLVNSSQFHGFERDDPHSHIRWFSKITSTLKYKNVPHDAIKLMLFPFSLEEAAQIWLEKEPPRSIHIWEDLVSNEAWDRFKDLLCKCPHHGFSKLHQIDMFYNALTQSDQDSLNAVAGGNILNRTPRDASTIIENKLKERILRNKPVVTKVNTTTSSSSPSLDITALTDIIKELVLMNKDDQQASMKAIEETCGPTVKEVGDIDLKETRIIVLPTKWDHPGFLLRMCRTDKTTTRIGSGTGTKGDKGQGANYTFKNFADALLHMPKFASMFKSLLSSKEKLFELASTSFNENCSAVPLKNLSKKLGDPDKFLIPCDFPELEECLALADLGASINLMPLSVWKKLLLSKLTSTHMTLKLANRSVAYPVGVAEDVFVKVGKFYFLADFVVVDYDVDPWVPLILKRPFLRMACTLIDVHGEELTLRVNDEAITFNVEHTSRYSHN